MAGKQRRIRPTLHITVDASVKAMAIEMDRHPARLIERLIADEYERRQEAGTLITPKYRVVRTPWYAIERL